MRHILADTTKMDAANVAATEIRVANGFWVTQMSTSVGRGGAGAGQLFGRVTTKALTTFVHLCGSLELALLAGNALARPRSRSLAVLKRRKNFVKIACHAFYFH